MPGCYLKLEKRLRLTGYFNITEEKDISLAASWPRAHVLEDAALGLPPRLSGPTSQWTARSSLECSSPVRVSRHLGAHGSLLGLLAGLPMVGLHPEGLQGLDLPSLESEGGARRQQRTHQWFTAQGVLPAQTATSWSDTRAVWSRAQDAAAIFAPWAGVGEGSAHL